MKRTIYILLFSFIVIIPILLGMASPMKMTDAREKKGIIQIETKPNLEIHEGYVSQKKETILVKKGKKTVAKVHLSEPVMVAQAEQEEEWGYFQFPSLGKADDGTLIVGWSMRADSHKTYGEVPLKSEGPLVSKDKGKTWQVKDKNYFAVGGSYHVNLDGNRILEVHTPKSRGIKSYKEFPCPIAKEGVRAYYSMTSLPDELQGTYFYDYKNGGRAKLIHAKLYDPGLLRYAIDELMPICWWGNIKRLKDNSLVAGVYPTYYLDIDGNVTPGGVSFYRSEDVGHTWSVVGKIPYEDDDWGKKRNYKGFDEPTFEILKDSSFICVMRSGAADPMYKTYSYDFGKTWTKPEAFTPNGVKPNLLLLENGVLVLVSGRPGVQIRFSFDGKGNTWTQPIDMMPFMKNGDSFDIYASCGYASIVESGDNSFYIVYSDFKQRNDNGDERKAIMFREVSIMNIN